MFTSMRIRNFKSWADTEDIRLAPITALFGTNSSGKTSLLQALLLLKQTAESSDRHTPLHFGNQSSLVNLGDFQSVVYKHDTSKELSFQIGWEAYEPVAIPDLRFRAIKERELEFETRLRAESPNGKTSRVFVEEMAYSAGDATFSMVRKPETSPEYDLLSENWPVTFQRIQGRPWPLPAPEQFHRFPDQVRSYYQNASFLADLELALEKQLRRAYYLGPLRASPLRTYSWSGSQPSDMGRAGENAVDAILSAVDRNETVPPGRGGRRVQFDQFIASKLKDVGLLSDFQVEPIAEGAQIFTVRVKKTPESPYVLLTDVGFGVSQILPVVVLCFYAPEGSTVILEQPEIHLHPAVQPGLADVLIDAVKKRKIQIILESHSEHLMRRMQRRIAEGMLSETDVALYFCENDGEKSTASPLAVDDLGNISNWPREFFGDQFGEMAQTQLARLNRMESAK